MRYVGLPIATATVEVQLSGRSWHERVTTTETITSLSMQNHAEGKDIMCTSAHRFFIAGVFAKMSVGKVVM